MKGKNKEGKKADNNAEKNTAKNAERNTEIKGEKQEKKGSAKTKTSSLHGATKAQSSIIGLSVCHPGTEDLCAKEITEIIGAKTEEKEGCVIFHPKELTDLCRLCYLSQSSRRVMLLLLSFDMEELKNKEKKKELASKIGSIDLKFWIDDKKTFAARCLKEEFDEIGTGEVEEEIGGALYDSMKNLKGVSPTVNLTNPDVTFLIYINKSQAYLGVDFGGDLSKRDYNIFTVAQSLKGTMAYSLLRAAGYTGKETVLDPFARTGIIPIEAAFYANKVSLNHLSKDKFLFIKLMAFKGMDFDKFLSGIDEEIEKRKDNKIKRRVICMDRTFHFISNAKKNAKIAGVEREIEFSRMDPEWIDTKIGKGAADLIVSYPPQPSKQIRPSDTEKLYNEIFYQAEYVLSNNGSVCLISVEKDLLTKAAEKNKMHLVSQRDVMQGKYKMMILLFKKKTG